MLYIGLDVHKEFCQACVIDEHGRVLSNEKFSSTQDELDRFLAGFKDDRAGLACTTFFDLAMQRPPSGFEYETIAAASRSPALKKIENDLVDGEIGVIARFLDDRKKKGLLAADLDTHQMERILIGLYRGLTADLILGAEKEEVRKAWIEATARLLAGPSMKRSRDKT